MSKSKKIRKSLKEKGLNPDERIYVSKRNSNNSITIMLASDCGRSIYQNIKKGGRQK
tara:strand:+ start:77 stop:247 length:171 start_codon:yes stop_codon:yes gene_type:complete